jgi:hypothetical protein
MAVHKFEAPYGLVFNLDQYAGNYERDFCGYVIGATGQCGVGEEMAELYNEDNPQGTPFYALSDMCAQEPDDNGCYRPTSMHRDPDYDVPEVGHGFASVIIFLGSVPSDDVIAMVSERAKRFCAERPDWKSYMGEIKPLNLKGIKLISNKVERVVRVEKVFEVS